MNHWQLLCNYSGKYCHNCAGFSLCISGHEQGILPILMCVKANFISFPYPRLSDSFIFRLADLCDIPQSSPFANHTRRLRLPSALQAPAKSQESCYTGTF